MRKQENIFDGQNDLKNLSEQRFTVVQKDRFQ